MQTKFAAGKNGDRVADICDHNFSELYSAFLAFRVPYYVNSATGSDSLYEGLSADRPFATIQKAVDTASDGDVLLLRGTFMESVVCTKKLSFINVGDTLNDCIWMESAAGQTLLTLSGGATNCLVDGIRFRVPTAGGIGIAMTNSDYTVVRNCSFQGRAGSYYGIYVAGGSQFKILDNTFAYLNTDTYGCGILGHSTTVMPAGAEIARNVFHSNLRHVKASLRQSFVHDNLFQEIGLGNANGALTATVKLDIYGEIAGAQYNTVTRNMMQGAYAVGGYKAGTHDNWFGNASDQVGETGVTAEGTTTAVPA
jgi:hypothetical protein